MTPLRPRRKQNRPTEVYELQDLTVHEVSLVDQPAIGREFLVTKKLESQSLPEESHRRASIEAEKDRAFWAAMSVVMHDLRLRVESLTKTVKELVAVEKAKREARSPLNSNDVIRIIEREVADARGWAGRNGHKASSF